MKLRYVPIILAAMLLAAHFLRSFSFLPMLLCLLAPLLLLMHRRWSILILQFSTIPAALIWVITLYGIIQQRIFEQRSWTASAIILGTVAVFTLFAGWLLGFPNIKQHYSA